MLDEHAARYLDALARGQVHDPTTIRDHRKKSLRQKEDTLQMDVHQPVEIVLARGSEGRVDADWVVGRFAEI